MFLSQAACATRHMGDFGDGVLGAPLDRLRGCCRMWEQVDIPVRFGNLSAGSILVQLTTAGTRRAAWAR